jgi:hypothetical protein
VAASQPYEGLEIEENLGDQHIQWRVERAWWVVLGGLLAAAVAGLFGSGALSSEEAGSESASVRYNRILRNDAPSTLRIDGPAARPLAIAISSGYLDAIAILEINPEPESTSFEDDFVVYTFEVTGAADKQATVTFRFAPQEIGRLAVTVTVNGEEIEFNQFVYP